MRALVRWLFNRLVVLLFGDPVRDFNLDEILDEIVDTYPWARAA